MYTGLKPNAKGLIDASFVLTTIGQFTLLLLGATLLLSHGPNKRSATLVNLLVIAFLSTFPPYFLMYGAAILQKNPPVALCVTQTALMDGSGTMFSMASLALVIDLMVDIRIFTLPASSAKYTQTLLVTAPYVVFFVFSVSALALGLLYPDQVTHMPNELACSIRNTTFAIAMQIVIVLTLTTTLCLEIYTIVNTLRTRHKLSDRRRPNLLSTSQAVRIVGFTSLQAFLLIVSALDIYVPSPGLHIASIIYGALMPLGTFVIFGTTEDCISIWKKWVTFAKCRRTAKRNLPAIEHVQVEVTVEKHTGDYTKLRPIHIQLEGLTV